MNNPIRFPYSTFTDPQGLSFSRLMMPIVLTLNGQATSTNALLDTGADINILPFHIGVALGADWTAQGPLTAVSGNLGKYGARGIMLAMTAHPFDPVRMAFAWIQNDNTPIILGQVNFFQLFNVCFFASADVFQIQLKE